jgi:hypothetical protein
MTHLLCNFLSKIVVPGGRLLEQISGENLILGWNLTPVIAVQRREYVVFNHQIAHLRVYQLEH